MVTLMVTLLVGLLLIHLFVCGLIQRLREVYCSVVDLTWGRLSVELSVEEA